MKYPNESILKKCLRIFKRFWVDGSGLTIQAILFLFIVVLVSICLNARKGYLKKESLTIAEKVLRLEKRVAKLEGKYV